MMLLKLKYISGVYLPAHREVWNKFVNPYKYEFAGELIPTATLQGK